MTDLSPYILVPGRTVVGGAPEGLDAFLITGAMEKAEGPVLVIARDDLRRTRLAQHFAFTAPDVPVLELPAWDCLPYDRVSPKPDIVAARLDALCKLAQSPDERRIVITTANASTQRVPPQATLRSAGLHLVVGGSIKQDAFNTFLVDNGYHRTGTVREPGEFAVRGGIVDLFPPGEENPLRLDFFGDELETIRRFDAGTQRSLAEDKKRKTLTEIVLRPVAEVTLNDSAIQTFRRSYREAFGVGSESDEIFSAISAGRHHPGMEHWLPFFHDTLETVFDYVPGAPVFLDSDMASVVESRMEAIADYYAARLDMVPKKSPGTEGANNDEASLIYRPVPAARHFLDEAEWFERLGQRPVIAFSTYALPEGGDESERRLDAGGRPALDFATARADPNRDLFQEVGVRLKAETKRRILFAVYSDGAAARLTQLFHEHGLPDLHPVNTWAEEAGLAIGTPGLAVLELDHGFSRDDLVVWTEQDVLGERLARPPRRRRRAEEFISEVSSLSEGDLVVHIDHGIGRYDGLETLSVDSAPHDCLRVIYAGGDKLFVPVENIDTLARYGSEDSGVQLDKLGGVAWQARKARMKERVREMAAHLLKIAAERELKKAEAITPGEGGYDEFVARFAFSETDDQLRAIGDVLEDLAKGRAMDRLICGDVGFGKTEVALRAAYAAAMNGLQVAVVVPTTLLARQHFRNFRERFDGLPVKVAQLSRLVTAKDATATRLELAEGGVDIIVGTHALLSKSIKFKDLGLLIVDEEQHFGVGQKERLKQLKANVHVLTLTATPIPRTLQMALTGVREMSIIASPPVDRLAVRTFVTPYDPVVVKEAIQRERHRGGQVFYVCPRVADLGRVAERLRDLLPDIRMAVAHGQISPTELENVMSDFVDGKYDVLLSTNIVESGLDIPTANTMIVHRSDMFGLSQLYQLRGRIGRAKQRGYCYLTLPPNRNVSESAKKRLEVMQTLDSLGAGFTLASHDLDIRGAGNLLGEEQSGHIKEVGVELYQRMLEEAVAAARDDFPEDVEETWSPTINIGAAVLIPENYVSDLPVRLGLYRRLSGLKDRKEIDAFAVELIDRFGSLPEAVENLLKVVEIKQLCRKAGIEKVEAGPKGAVITFRNNSFANPQGLVGFIQKSLNTIKLRPDHKLVVMRAWDTPKQRIKGVARCATDLADVAS